ncbi:MutS-related protein [Polaribacter sp. HL-MS24]|uniref:MutS-related protein n=1 Tax=Polaribacter sp. HL-MS24 TaxID=3077735 RepID=UPI002934295C|nr:DNA mismatch repair protein [Polaribacter sp. HL-MS24]WOC39621.1 DNA mismatch repair protein [Polaribacter sp. HL-MS24]
MEYIKLKDQYSGDYNRLQKKHNLISITRLFTIIVLVFLIYKSLETSDTIYTLIGISVFFFFIFLMKIHEKISWNRELKKQQISINNDEIIYLKGERIPFENGSQYINLRHFYSFDLDFFGTNSLFHHLNRTATYIGSKKLSDLLVSLLKNNEITSNQKAIKELSKKIEWRQHLLSLAKTTKDSEDNYQKLINWAEYKQEKIPKILIFIFYTTPIVFIGLLIISILMQNPFFTSITFSCFLMNLGLTLTQLKKIKKEVIDSDKISEIIKQYGLIIEKIETEKFDNDKLNSLKEKLIYKAGFASTQIKKLSSLFYNLENIQNGLAAVLFNGAFLYHIHTLNNLLNWKKRYSEHIKKWLDIIGEFETLNSFANFSYNNPTFIFPKINKNYDIVFEELGHPLIQKEKRICNDIEFKKNNFMILTGSNMSGKSTFLRTLGMNMVLAGIGAPICSTKASVHPLNVIVSMRQTDSLNDGESYFFAEVKRLKKIMDTLQSETCFVLLDEILKGTNSDDKQIGTIEVLKKIISKNAIGSIATHDLEICKITNNYPNKLFNKCFEAEIIDNNLSFDFKIKDGICKNKSATFIMKKMEII